ncbi:MAG: ATP-binding protein [Treponema sp.]|nr:ATP-binding protein [Treponema sp.]
MSKIRIKNCGPIISGLDSNDGFIEFGKYTLFIGDQGTGKSTVAKLISIFSWLEKALFRGDYDANSFDAVDFRYLYQNQLLSDFFNEETEIEYIGVAYHFLYRNNIFSIEKRDNTFESYIRPKIMYIPSERNILSVVKNIEELENIPPMLRLLRRRYLLAASPVNGNNVHNLPLTGYKAVVNASNGETFVQSENSNTLVPLICASSGLQSIVPSSLVTEYLANQSTKGVLDKIRNLNEKRYELLKLSLNNEEIKIELDRFYTSGVSKSISKESFSELEFAARKFTNGCFLNVVEEPEQNLFPQSQMKNLEFLLDCANCNENNSLIITTHSPYILSYITLAAKVFDLLQRGVPQARLKNIVPVQSAVDGNQVIIYETHDDGTITKLNSYDSLPSDENLLNKAMALGNELFADLLDLEQEFCS